MNKPVILVVDDQPPVCDLIKMMLGGEYVVRAFTSGSQVKDYLSNNTADLALLDYDMPNMTGYEVMMFIRSNKRSSQMPIIFVTAVQNIRMEMEMMERGANSYLRKPIQKDELIMRIEEQLKNIKA